MILMKKTVLITAFLFLFAGFAAAQTSSNIQIELKDTEPTPLQTSEYADVWLEVRNNGSASANDVNIRFNENYPFTVDRGERRNWSIPELVPGDTYQLHLQTRVDDNAVQGENRLNFDVETPSLTFEEEVPVEVRSDRNVLAIDNVAFPAKAAPGSSNSMDLRLENLADGQVKNVQVNLDFGSDDLPLASKGSSQKNVVSIEPGETRNISYTLDIDESAENGVYKLPIDITFENEAGTQFNQSASTSVNIGGEPRLRAGLNSEEPLRDGETREVTFRLVNQGYGSAEFVSLELEETDVVEVIGSNDEYIGSMDSDDFQTASFQVNVDAETESVERDEVDFPVRINYSDSMGERAVTQNVSAELYTQEEIQRYGLGNTGNPLPLILIILVVLGGGVFYWRKRKKE